MLFFFFATNLTVTPLNISRLTSFYEQNRMLGGKVLKILLSSPDIHAILKSYL